MWCAYFPLLTQIYCHHLSINKVLIPFFPHRSTVTDSCWGMEVPHDTDWTVGLSGDSLIGQTTRGNNPVPQSSARRQESLSLWRRWILRGRFVLPPLTSSLLFLDWKTLSNMAHPIHNLATTSHQSKHRLSLKREFPQILVYPEPYNKVIIKLLSR